MSLAYQLALLFVLALSHSCLAFKHGQIGPIRSLSRFSALLLSKEPISSQGDIFIWLSHRKFPPFAPSIKHDTRLFLPILDLLFTVINVLKRDHRILQTSCDDHREEIRSRCVTCDIAVIMCRLGDRGL